MTREEQIKNYAINNCIQDDIDDTSYELIIETANWADETMINKACKWLKENMYVEHIFEYNEDEEPKQYVCASASDSVDEFVNNFCKAMEK